MSVSGTCRTNCALCRTDVAETNNSTRCDDTLDVRSGGTPTGSPRSLRSYSKQCQNATVHFIFTQNNPTFLGGDTTLFPNTFSHPIPQVRPLHLDPGYATAKIGGFSQNPIIRPHPRDSVVSRVEAAQLILRKISQLFAIRCHDLKKSISVGTPPPGHCCRSSSRFPGQAYCSWTQGVLLLRQEQGRRHHRSWEGHVPTTFAGCTTQGVQPNLRCTPAGYYSR